MGPRKTENKKVAERGARSLRKHFQFDVTLKTSGFSPKGNHHSGVGAFPGKLLTKPGPQGTISSRTSSHEGQRVARR